jgi:hypothetical protein
MPCSYIYLIFEDFIVINNNSLYKKDCITFDDHTSVDNTFVHNSFADNIVVDNTFVDNTFVSDQQVNILLSDDSIDLCNYSNDSQNSRSNICNGSIEFIDDQFSPDNSSSCSSSNAEDSLNCTVKNGIINRSMFIKSNTIFFI